MNLEMSNRLRINTIIAILTTFSSSYFIDLFFVNGLHLAVETTQMIKLSLLILIFLFCVSSERYSVNQKYVLIMFVVLAANLGSLNIRDMLWFKQLFNQNSFVGSVGSNVLIKLGVSSIIILVLLVFYRSKQKSYLNLGNLSTYASEIKFLGISNQEIKWSKLSVLSAILIAFGTLLLTLITFVSSIGSLHFRLLLTNFPIILVFATINAFAEGIIYRNTVIAPLSAHLPKNLVILLSAILFGSFHYHGVPSGFIGVIMSSVLGWFIARSVYETEGFFAGWFIHFMQDVVIFSTVVLISGGLL